MRGRKYERSRGGRRVAIRRALRRSYQTGGVVVSLPTEAIERTWPRCLLLVDVSRSMLDVLDRDFLLRVLVAFHSHCGSVRSFFFDTDVREMTDVLEERSAERVSAALERTEAEWGGGTKIGESLLQIRDEAPHAVDHRTVVIVVSDGLETGNVDDLETGIVWLSNRSRLLLWLNPLATSPEFEPASQGMQTVRPYVDGLFPFADVDSIEEMVRQLRRYDGTQPLGYDRKLDQ